MAYIANQQRKTFNEQKVKNNFPITVATFQINKRFAGGGDYPHSLFKIQANWASGSVGTGYLVNSELYVNQTITEDISGDDVICYLPEGETDITDGNFPISFLEQPSPLINVNKYSHLLFGDYSEIYDFFKISFQNIKEDTDPNYYTIDVVITTPDFIDGDLMVDSYCYILNTL
jgi:hypothetical protein